MSRALVALTTSESSFSFSSSRRLVFVVTLILTITIHTSLAWRMHSLLRRGASLSSSRLSVCRRRPLRTLARTYYHHHHHHQLAFTRQEYQPSRHRRATTRLFSSAPTCSFPAEYFSFETIMKDPNHTDYEHWVRRLYATNMFHPVKLGLQNMKQLHSLLGNPMDQMDKVKVIHVAGTNGKGSVCLKIANTLQNYTSSSGQNRKVGLFCSPHVSSFRERMQVNGVPISEKQVVDLLPKLYKLCREHDIPATFFELTTALAFSFFDEEGCDVVVLETGLGGRLDATNVVQNPALTCITSIGLEHTRILGDTVELIAREKAGILKRGRPVVCGPDVPHETILECAKEVGAGRYYLPDTVLETQIDRKITDYDVQNQRISKACLTLFRDMYPEIAGDLTDEAMDKGVIIRPPCRFEEIKAGNGVNVILDVAHNPQAMEYLVDKVKATYPDSSFRFVIGMSSDKDLKQCGDSISTILSSPSSIHLIQAAHPRAATVEAILDANPSWKEQANYDLEDRSITKQVHTALEVAAKSNEILIVCGSVFVMAEAREAIGIEEPRDSDFISEMAGAGARHGQENFGNTPTSDDEEDTKTT